VNPSFLFFDNRYKWFINGKKLFLGRGKEEIEIIEQGIL